MILVIATSRQTKGGITSVVEAHEKGEQWKKNKCKWIQTHRDGGAIRKLWYLGTALIHFLILVPFCDAVHIHLSEMNSTLRKMLFFRIAKSFGKKTIVHFHSFSTETTIHSKYRSRYEYIFTNADRVIVLSEYWQKAVCQEFGLSRDNVCILYNPCPMVENPTSELREKNILYAGAVNARKGYKDLLNAFARIAKKYPDWNLVFAGAGEVEEGKVLANNLGIVDQVEFLGWVVGTKKEIAFRKASFLCLPSYAEGFPMAVLDAWAYGLPVITTPVGGIPDVAKDGENMLLFNPGDIDTLSLKLERMISDNDLRHRIEAASRTFATKTFNINTINAQLDAIYDNLLDR